jgi:hypothetical protein
MLSQFVPGEKRQKEEKTEMELLFPYTEEEGEVFFPPFLSTLFLLLE